MGSLEERLAGAKGAAMKSLAGDLARLSPQQRAALETLLLQRQGSRSQGKPEEKLVARSRKGDPARCPTRSSGSDSSISSNRAARCTTCRWRCTSKGLFAPRC